MKKVFNASILAAAVAMSFGANAATVSSTPAQLSAEGLEVGLNSTANIVFDVVVSKEHASSSEIVLTLSDKVDLATNSVVGGACTNTPSAGTGLCGNVAFDYGTGSFTFDSVVVDDAANTITFNVNLGNPLTANSAFRVTIGGAGNGGAPAAAAPIVSGASTVAYASNLAGTPIETGTGIIATEAQQYAMSVKTQLDGVLERVNRDSFVRNGATSTTDTLVLNVADLKASVANPAFANGTVVTLKGDFSDTAIHAPAQWVSAEGATVAAVDANTLTLTYTEAQFGTAATAKLDTVTFTYVGAGAIDPTDFTVSAKHDFNSLAAGAGTDGTETLMAALTNAGKWTLDASVVNVPYLPVGYGLSPNVEIANNSAKGTESEVILEAFDQFGTQYGPVTLAKKANGQTVTKVSEKDMMEAFQIPADTGRKLSVTFIIDADADKVTLAPYYRQNESRVNVMSDQYKGKTTTCTSTTTNDTTTTNVNVLTCN